MTEIKKIIKYIKPYKKKLIITSIFLIIYSILYILSPKILSQAINRLVSNLNNGLNKSDYNFIIKILMICFFMYIFTNVIKYMCSIVINRICNKISYKLRKDISIKLNKLKLNYFEDNSYGEVISRISNDVDNICTNLEQILIEFISTIICFFGVLIMMFSISKFMTLITLIVIPIQIVLMVFIMFKSQKYFNNRQEIVSLLDGEVISKIKSYKFIKLNNLEKNEIKKFENINNDLYNVSFKSDFLSSIILPIISFVSNLSYIIISVFGGLSVINGSLIIGDLQAFLQYIKKLQDNSDSIGGFSSSFQGIYASIKHVNSFLELDEEVIKPSKNGVVLDGEIEFRNVSFSYDNKNKVISDLNIRINKGDNIAIVGDTGCGKTTLMNLLLKFYNNYNGEILINGIDIKNIDTHYLRNKIGIVLQNTFVFNDSVINNIKFGDSFNKEFKSIDNKFKFSSYLNYNTVINEDEDNISEGEKQLISIYRTLIRDNDIVILDEATSNIDSRTEALIQDLTSSLMKDKTSIIIAHRLSTIKKAKYIVVLDKGKICEMGNHNELIKLNGKYAELYKCSI